AIHESTELLKLQLRGCENLPDFATLFLYCERPKSHLETCQQSRECSWPRDCDSVLGLQLIHQACPSDYLCEESLSGEIHDREIRGDRRLYVFPTNILRCDPNGRLQFFTSLLNILLISSNLSVLQALPCFLRKFRIDRKQHVFASCSAGQFYCKFYCLLRPRPD